MTEAFFWAWMANAGIFVLFVLAGLAGTFAIGFICEVIEKRFGPGALGTVGIVVCALALLLIFSYMKTSDDFANKPKPPAEAVEQKNG